MKREKKTQECQHQWAPLLAKTGKQTIPSLVQVCLRCGELKVGKKTIRISKYRLDMGGLPIRNLAAPSVDTDAPRARASDILSGRFPVDRLPAMTNDKIWRGTGGNIEEVDDVAAITFIIDGGCAAITTGSKGYLEIAFACTITGWTISADQSGSIVVDVRRCTFAGFPTTTSIAGTEKPMLSAAQKNQDLSLTTWGTSVAVGDILEFVVDSAATVRRVTISLRAVKT